MSGASNYSPYEANVKGFVEVLQDLDETLSATAVTSVAGFEAVVFENVSQGQPLYSRSSDGKLGLATAGGTEDEARVAGFAQSSKTTGQTARCIVYGLSAATNVTAGALCYLNVGYGGVTTTPPSEAGQYITRVGQAISGASLHVRIEPPIKVG
tara:strand:- start:2367 stop:2828 length:462 start_codon:yes stop_codon:yes gene_type:complete